MKNEFDIAVIGGGVTGSAVGYGLARSGKRVVLVDEVPVHSRASRANTGLVWCQAKGAGRPAYSRWSFASAAGYAGFAAEIQRAGGIDIRFELTGGITPVLGEKGFADRVAYLEKMTGQSESGRFPVRMLERPELEKMLPRVEFGPDVTGGSYCEDEGYVSPLHLLFGMRKAFVRSGGTLLHGTRARRVRREGDGYAVQTENAALRAEKLVLAAGLGSPALGLQLGFKVPIRPNRGQKMLLERFPEDVLPVPLHNILRSRGGTVLLGTEHEESGFDLSTVPEVLALTAATSMRIWPKLAEARVLRTWAGLRVWPDDGLPVYDRVPGHANAFIFAMHSAVTQAPMIADQAAAFVLGKEVSPDFSLFSLSRFADGRQ